MPFVSTATITTPPSDVIVCTGGVAVFTCVVDRNGTDIACDDVMWDQIRVDINQPSRISERNEVFSINTTLSGDTLNSTLTITGATGSNVLRASSYRCIVPDSDLMSRSATISVVTSKFILC